MTSAGDVVEPTGPVGPCHATDLGGDGPRSGSIELSARPVTVQTAFDGSTYSATLDQGRPEYGSPVTAAALAPVLRGLGLSPADALCVWKSGPAWTPRRICICGRRHEAT